MNKYTRLLTTLGVLALFLVYFFANLSKFRPLLDVSLPPLLLIAVGDLALVASNGFFTKFILRPFNKWISIVESFYVSLISSVGNFFAPAGAGFAFRAVYLKRRHGLTYSHYISLLFGNYIVVFLINSFFGLIALLLLRDKANHQFMVLALVFLSIFLASLTLTFIRLPKLTGGKLAANLQKVSDGWRQIAEHRQLMVQLTFVTLVNLGLTVAVTWLIIRSLHLQVGLAALLLFSTLGSLSLFINVTPANLGVKEAIYLFSSSVLGFSVSQILSIALIDRGVMFLVLTVLWAISHKLKSPLSE